MVRRIFIWFLILGLLVVPILTPVFGLSTEAIEANNSLSVAESAINEFEELNLSTQRVSDIYFRTQQLYDAQVALEKAGGKPDYSMIFSSAKEIKSLKEKAFLLADELKALKLRINESKVNTSEAMVIYRNAVKEFEDERYEESEKLVERTYAKLSDLESSAARVAAFYDAMSKTFENFIKENFKKIILLIAIILITFLVFRNRIKVYKLKKELERLELRKKILKELIARTQQDYFGKGVIGKDNYLLRVDKFEELIRDINGQIPLVKEKLTGVKKPEVEKVVWEREELERKKEEELRKREIEENRKKKLRLRLEEERKGEKERRKLEKTKRKERIKLEKERRKELKKKKKIEEKLGREKEQQARIKKKVEKLGEDDLKEITEGFLKLEKKIKKPENPIKRIAYEIDIYRRRKKIEKKLKKIE